MTASTLSVQGLPITEIAERFGTPFYLYDGDYLVENLRNLQAHLPEQVDIFFSLKSNPNVSVYATLHGAGACAEVSSHVELTTALLAGTDARDIVFLGPGKDREEIVACLKADIYAIIVESFEELELINTLAADCPHKARVALRINPSFSVKGSGLTMGGKPRQFGIDEAHVRERSLAGLERIELIGYQVYMGTRILDAQVITENTRQILALAEELAELHGIDLKMVDFGGGLGVPYFEGEQFFDLDLMEQGMRPLLDEFVQRHPGTRLIMESGRFLTAMCGMYVSRVRYTKRSYDQNFAVTDGGTNHHMAAVGVGSFVKRNFPIELVSRESDEAPEPWNVSGPLCTPNDLIAKMVDLPPLRTGDLVAVMRSGAYGPSASPGYFLSHGFPAEVLVSGGQAYLVRKPDLPEDLLAKQQLVRPHLQAATA